MLRQSELTNRILSRLSSNDFSLLADQLEPAIYGRGEILSEASEPVDFIHFVERGLVSIVAKSPEGQATEAGIIGREGFVHPALILGSDRLPFACQIQMQGDGHRIRRTVLQQAVDRSASLRELLLKFVAVYSAQVGFTSLSNAVHQVDERLARWLLMCHDRNVSDDLPLTHEFIGLMLAVRRPSVTNALHVLEGNGFLKTDRGYVTICNRTSLEEFAGDAYGEPEAEYRRLLGPL